MNMKHVPARTRAHRPHGRVLKVTPREPQGTRVWVENTSDHINHSEKSVVAHLYYTSAQAEISKQHSAFIRNEKVTCGDISVNNLHKVSQERLYHGTTEYIADELASTTGQRSYCPTNPQQCEPSVTWPLLSAAIFKYYWRKLHDWAPKDSDFCCTFPINARKGTSRGSVIFIPSACRGTTTRTHDTCRAWKYYRAHRKHRIEDGSGAWVGPYSRRDQYRLENHAVILYDFNVDINTWNGMAEQQR